MDNRYRNQNNRNDRNFGGNRQQEQFSGQSSQYGDNRSTSYDDYGFSGGYQRDNFSRGFDSDRNRANFGDRYSQNSDYNALNDYDQQPQSFGRSNQNYGGQNYSGQNYGSQNYRDEDYSRGGMGQSRQSFGGGYGDIGRNDYYGGSDYGYGNDYGRDEMGSRYYAGQGGRYRSSSFDRNDDQGFFDRMGDKIGGWFGDDNDSQRRSGGSSYRGHGPTNYKRSDERILEDACDRLTDDHRIDGRNIEVTVKDGEVTLDGFVDSRMAKRRAEDCVHDVSGVSHVQNNLRVQERSSGFGGNDRYDNRTDIGDLEESRSVKRDSDATNKATGKPATEINS